MTVSAAYDHAAVAFPLDASDVADISLGINDTVRVEYETSDAFRSLRRFTGTVVGVFGDGARVKVQFVDPFSNLEREWWFAADVVQLLVKAGSLVREGE